jgi:hypothetical protein
MAFLLQRPLFSCATAALGLSGAAYGLLSHQHRNPLRLDSGSNPITSSSTSPKDWSFSQYQHDAQAPVVNSRGGLNAKAVRQMTLGSILGALPSSSPKPTFTLKLTPPTGLVSGLTVSLFSKPLALLLGLAFLGLHTAEKQLGISIIPYNTVQKYVTNVDLRSAVQDNAALKISFGTMFALSGFASF